MRGADAAVNGNDGGPCAFWSHYRWDRGFHTMKNTLLGAGAAFAIVATGVCASAQDTQHQEGQRQENHGAERAPAPGGAARKEAPGGERAQNGEMRKDEAPRAAEGEPRPSNGAMTKDHAPKAAEGETRPPNGAMSKEHAPKAAETERRQPEGAATKDGAPKAAETERRENGVEPPRENPRAAEGERPKDESPRKDATRADQPRAAEGAAKPGDRTAARGTPRVQGVRISADHALRIDEALRHDAHRVRPNFDVRVGTRIPEDFALLTLPPEIVEIEPQYRGYDYFIDDSDEIVFVSPDTHEIVGTIDYDNRAASVDAPRAARPCPTED